ncbi:MAG: HD domain-containing protein [Bacteroidales bacterium]|nr:HD domain-containing protein [Bacteroidales bacterium]
MSISIRHSQAADLDLLLQMFDHSRQLMRQSGNLVQWQGYPSPADLLADINAHTSLVLTQKGHPIATLALVPGADPHYQHIDNGQWLDPDTPYATLHRLAKLPQADGLHPAHRLIAFAQSQFSHLRLDTHPTNAALQHIALQHHFAPCGIVHMDDHTPRIAYEWHRWEEIPTTLHHHIDRHILPHYDHFDPAHRRDHALRVIARSMLLRRLLATTTPEALLGSPACLYIAAACHDIGLHRGRDLHHTASAQFILHHAPFRQWLSSDEIILAAEAAEDHRASAAQPPRSIVGRILAEADRDIHPTRIIRRTIAYSLHHYPTLDRQGHFLRTLQHLQEKYSPSGYLHLLLPQSPNAQPLADLQALIADPPRLQNLFDQLFLQLTTSSAPLPKSHLQDT